MSHDNENGKPTSGPVEPELDESGTDEPKDAAIVDDLAARLEALAVERDRLAAENEELRNHTLRQRADYENLRKRSEKEKADLADYASGETVRELLPILDDFQRALGLVPEEIGEENEYVKGVRMIYVRLIETLKRIGLEPVESLGKPFDPNFHHAVERVPTADAEENTIVEEWQKGYTFRGRLLREAMVKVAAEAPIEE